MSSVWGKNIQLSIFGESHGKALGITIHGLPAGVKLDLSDICKELRRRAPGQNEYSTNRKEDDDFEIISGFFNGVTTGASLCAMIWNKDRRSEDYEKMKNIMRPGHADYTGFVRYDGFNDYRGGGHFSGRITAALVFAGAIAKQIIFQRGIIIGSHIYHIGGICDQTFNEVDLNLDLIESLREKSFSVINDEKGKEMRVIIAKAKEDLDSVGGVVETAVLNLPPGIGSPFFNSVESVLSHILFSIPAVKGVEFGEGFNISKMSGSEANDEYYIKDKEIKTYTNNNGGILGGITNGMPLIVRTAFKPTPSIAKAQKTINIENKQQVILEIKGRHDPCIVPRALAIVEGACALAILDLIQDLNKL